MVQYMRSLNHPLWSRIVEQSSSIIISYRLLISLSYTLLVWWTPSVRHDGRFPVSYYAVVLLIYAVHQVSPLHPGPVSSVSPSHLILDFTR